MLAYNSIADYDDLIACALHVPYELRVDAGSGTDTVDTAGRTWLAGRFYAAGSWGFTDGVTAATTDPIAGTADDLQYQTVHWGYGAWKLKADVPNGPYRVNLGFTETYFTAADIRVFNVKIEGQTVITGLDLFAVAGHDAAYRRSFDVTVSDGQLDIEFVSVKNAALVAVIEVLGTGSTAPPHPHSHADHNPHADRDPHRHAHAHADRRYADWRVGPPRSGHQGGRAASRRDAGAAPAPTTKMTSRSPQRRLAPMAPMCSPASRRCRPDGAIMYATGPTAPTHCALLLVRPESRELHRERQCPPATSTSPT